MGMVPGIGIAGSEVLDGSYHPIGHGRRYRYRRQTFFRVVITPLGMGIGVGIAGREVLDGGAPPSGMGIGIAGPEVVEDG